MQPQRLALIGYPTSQSKSADYHNYFFDNIKLNARYEKFDVKADQLSDFLQKAKQNMLGLSVTMPLKEHIIPLLDELDESAKQIGAVNTVKFIHGKAKGYNTDAIGAFKAIKHCYPGSLAGKNAILVGAGGAAKAIAWALSQAHMQITIANRSAEKAAALANVYQAKICSMEELDALLKNNCDLLIQSTSIGMSNQDVIIPVDKVPVHVVVMDVISMPCNHWLDDLAQKGCVTISGKLMWIFQAIEQYKIWFSEEVDLSQAFPRLEQAMCSE